MTTLNKVEILIDVMENATYNFDRSSNWKNCRNGIANIVNATVTIEMRTKAE